MAETKPNVVVESRVRESIHAVKGADDFRLDGDAIDALNEKVEGLIKTAVKRAQENGRKTVRPADF
jgi:histone H3/H4